MRVAIIGTTPSSRMLAPYSDPEWKIWACSPGNQGQLPRVDIWFELHSIVDMTGAENKSWSLPYFGWLRQQQFPVYMQEKNDLVPQAIEFPRDLMLKKFGSLWFTSSVAWMMALAIHQGAKEIGLFGIDMAADMEHYTAQKAGCLRFIEIAKEHGITVTIPLESCLGKPLPLYGYSEATPMGRKLNVRLHEMQTRRAEINGQIERLTHERAYFDGAIEDTKYIMRTWLDGAEAELGNAPTLELEAKPLVETLAKVNTDDFEETAAGVLVPKAKVNGKGKAHAEG